MSDSPRGDGSQSEVSRQERLDSWKEIAAYLNRGTRTVQRWEREEGLPVHRLLHEKLGSVYAYRPELDAWWNSRKSDLNREAPEEPSPSVAVLPFEDMSQEKDQAYFCEGMAEEIILALGRVKGMRVASRTSSFQVKGASAGSREIGRRLRVLTLLEGSVRKSGSQLRITARLTNAEDGYQIWSGRFDREASDILAIQDEIARSIVAALEISLSPHESAALQRPPIKNLRAYDFYLRGRNYFYQYGAQDVDFARELFTRAIELDPDYAPAWAGLADCWSYTYIYAHRSEKARAEAEEASRRAAELDPASAQAQASSAVALSLSGRDEQAVAAFETAIRLDPNLFEAHYFFARHCFARGELEKAVTLYEQAMEVRPDDYQSPLLVAQIYHDLQKPEFARQSRRRGIEIAEEHLKWSPDDARAVYMAANGLAALGERERAREWADRALSMRPEEPMTLYNVGCVYSMLGHSGEAIECLERCVRNGLSQKGWFEHDNNLDPLRRHPRFKALLKKLK